jgi:capsular polysaccharide biosynthesis protein
VDLNEAARRILRHHWVLITLLTLIGLAVPLGLARLQGDSYVASARITIGVTDTRDGQEANALADTALALATSPEVITRALESTGLERDSTAVAEQIRVTPVGTSGVLEVSVTDPDPIASATLANTLAAEVVAMREESVLGGTQQLIEQIDAQIQELNALAGTLAADPDRLAQTVAQRSSLEQQRRELAQDVAGSIRPRVIDDSTAAGLPVSTALAARLAVGALLGLILGVALAAVLETWRPTLSRTGLSRYLDAPVLGSLPRPPHHSTVVKDPWLADYLRLGAEAAGARSIKLIPVGPHVDLSGLARSLENSELGGRRVTALQLDGTNPREASARRTMETDAGIVVVAPEVVKASALEHLERHVQLTKWPVIGIVTYAGKAKAQPVRHGAAEATAGSGEPVERVSAPTAAPVS